MFIGTRQLMSSYSVDFSISFTGRTHTPVDSARDLGVIMDSHLTYGSHISYLVSSCLSKLVQINRVKKSFVKDILMLIVSSLLFSKMFYCSSVWSNTSKNNIKRLQLIQNYACRIITSSQKYDHVTPLLQEQMRLLLFLSANEMLQFRDSVMAYKCAKIQRLSTYVQNLKKRSSVHEYLCIEFKKDHLFMIAQLATTISFISLYIRLLAVNTHFPIEQFLYGTLQTKVYNPPPHQTKVYNPAPQPGPSNVL